MTQEEKAIHWIGLESYNQWSLHNAKGEKVSEYDSADEDQNEAKERLSGILELQEPGRYSLKAWKGKSRNAAASVYNFELKRQTQPVPQNFGGMSQQNISFEEMMQKAKALALAEMEEKQFKEDVLKRLSAIESDINDLKKVMEDLTDNDDENDESALDRLESVGTKLPNIMKGLDSMKGIFSK